MEEETKQHPVEEWQAGSVTVAMWRSEEEVDDRIWVRWSARVKKSYKDKRTGEWKESDYYFPADLSDLAIVVRHALDYVRLRKGEKGSDVPADSV